MRGRPCGRPRSTPSSRTGSPGSWPTGSTTSTSAASSTSRRLGRLGSGCGRRAAERYADLGHERPLAAGHRVTAAEHLRRAALTLQFAQFVLTEQPALRASAATPPGRALRRLRPAVSTRRPAREVPVTLGQPVLALPAASPPAARDGAAGPPALVVLLPGAGVHQGAVQHLRAVLPRPRRGHPVARGARPGGAPRAVPGRLLRRHDGRGGRAHLACAARDHTTRVVVLGTSFGGHLALRFGSPAPRTAGHRRHRRSL